MVKKLDTQRLTRLIANVNSDAQHRKLVLNTINVLTWYDELFLELVEGIQYEKERSDKMQKAISDFLKWENEEDRGISEGHEAEWIEQTERLAVAIHEPETEASEETK